MHQGYFTTHNVKFKPNKGCDGYISNQDSVASDIDVIGFNPHIAGQRRVIAVSCKSWQNGFDVRSKLDELEKNKVVSGREAWRGFRELMVPKWSTAFIDAVESHTGTRRFTYWTAVTTLKDETSRSSWENHVGFLERLEGNPIEIKTFRDLMDGVWHQLKRTPAASELGRLIQLIKASKWSPPD